MTRFYLFILFLFTLAWLPACTEPGEINLESNNVLYHDEFVAGATGEWQLEGDDLGRTAVIDEQLQIAVDGPNLMQFTTLVEPQFTDFILTVDAVQMAGDLQSSYGVLVRMQDQSRFYRFAITGDGTYMIERRNGDGSWTRLVSDWTPTPSINQGLGIANRLRIDADGTTMRFYVNDMLLHQVTDAEYSSGMIGLTAGTWGQEGLQVAFDDLVMRRP